MTPDNSATYSDSTAFAANEANPLSSTSERKAHANHDSHGKECRHSILHRHHKKNFKGYTLEEMRLHKVVNDLKINAVKDRLAMMVSPRAKNEAGAVAGCINGFESFMRYVNIAMVAYGITRRVTAFFRRFSRH